MSLMFPTIFGLGLKDLGPNTKLGGSLIVMAIIGGAIFTPLMGWISQSLSMAKAMLVPLVSYLFIAYFAFVGSKVRVRWSQACERSADLRGIFVLVLCSDPICRVAASCTRMGRYIG